VFRLLIPKMNHPSYIRPPTPQALLHRAPNKQDVALSKPSKYIVLLLAPTSVAGKVQIATSVSKSLSCPLFQGDSLHESSAKAAAVGASRSNDGGRGRYQRMWFNKMTRTGLLFPEESRPANQGFSGFASTSTSRRGSASSISSTTSSNQSTIDIESKLMVSSVVSSTRQYINHPVLTASEEESQRKSNPALMVLTHPELEAWHRDAIREVTGEHGIGIIFVPLFKAYAEREEKVELPVLRLLDPRTVRDFTSFDALKAAARGETLKYGQGKEGNLDEEMVLDVNVEARVEDIIEEVSRGVTNVMFTPTMTE
jgi:hypothetical protein